MVSMKLPWWFWGIIMALLFGIATTFAQTPAPINSDPGKDEVKNQDDGALIELDEVEIIGEIAQPNVNFAVARQESELKDIMLHPTLTEGLTGADILNEFFVIPDAAKIEDWAELLNRPRD